MKRLILIALSFVPVLLFSQARITGTLLDQATKQPIPYASVYLPNQNVGTITDFNGNFSIYIADTSANNRILFSCVGYQKSAMSIRQIIKQKTVYLTASRIELSEAEVKAMSHQALIALLDKVFTKARSDKEEQSCKLFYALESAKEDEPLELIEAFCSAKQRMDLGLTEMKMKNGRIGVNTETEDKFMSLSSTNIIVNFNPFYVSSNIVGLPAVPSNLKTQKMTEQFSFWEDGLLKEDTATLQKISFRSKAEPTIEALSSFINIRCS